MSYSMQRVQSERDSRLQGRGECIAAVSGWLWKKKKMWKRVKAKAGWKKTEVEEGRLAQTSWW